MSTEVFLIIIAILGGIIIGGTGGSAIIRKNLRIDTPVQSTSNTEGCASGTNNDSVIHNELLRRMNSIDNIVSANTKEVNNLNNTVQRLLGECPEKHKAIEQRLRNLEK
jgi:hypothetical protein